MKRTGCPARSCPLELRAKGAGVQYVHRFDHTCRIVSFPVGKRYDFGFADSRAFCFLRGEGAPYPAYACMEILYGASPAPVCVSHRLCVIPRRGPGPKQVSFSRTGLRRSAGPFRTPPQRLLPAPAASFAQRARLCAEPARVPGPGPSRPCSPIFAVRRAFCHCIFFPVRFDLPCVPDRRTKIAAEKFPPPSRFFSIYVRTGYKTQ